MDAFARRRGIPSADYTDGIDKQALVPDGAHVIDPIGTAPGLIVPWAPATVVVLPGPPSELAQMWPIVEAHPAMTVMRGGEQLERSLLRVFNVSESVVARAFDEAGGDDAGTTTTICARRSEVEILVRAPASLRDARLRLADSMRDRLAADIFSEDERPLEELILDAARARGATIATAESCTAGLVATRLTDVAGSSDVVLGGIVAYANDVKHALLGVPGALLERHGAVSAECAEAMARGAITATGATIGVSTTGIAGPGRRDRREARGARVPALRVAVRRALAAGGVPGGSRRRQGFGVDGGAAPGVGVVALRAGSAGFRGLLFRGFAFRGFAFESFAFRRRSPVCGGGVTR